MIARDFPSGAIGRYAAPALGKGEKTARISRVLYTCRHAFHIKISAAPVDNFDGRE